MAESILRTPALATVPPPPMKPPILTTFPEMEETLEELVLMEVGIHQIPEVTPVETAGAMVVEVMEEAINSQGPSQVCLSFP